MRAGALTGRTSLVNGTFMQHFGRNQNAGDIRAKLEVQVRSIQFIFTHRSVSTFDRSPFQLTDELFLYGMALSRTGNKTRSAEPPATAISTTTKCDDACRCC